MTHEAPDSSRTLLTCKEAARYLSALASRLRRKHWRANSTKARDRFVPMSGPRHVRARAPRRLFRKPAHGAAPFVEGTAPPDRAARLCADKPLRSPTLRPILSRAGRSTVVPGNIGYRSSVRSEREVRETLRAPAATAVSDVRGASLRALLVWSKSRRSN